MNQLEIQFFFPLTEQIPLRLDYTGCDNKPKLTYYPLSGGTGTISPSQFAFYPSAPTWTTSINIDQTNITITSKNKQPLYRRVLYKLLGINWKCET